MSRANSAPENALEPAKRKLTAAAYQGLADMPPEMAWFANLGNAATRRAYETALKDFIRFTAIEQPEEFRTVTRAHVIAWRDELAGRELSATTIRHRLSALASLFDYLCDQNAVTHNPVKGVKRPVPETSEGKTPALGDHQARKLLASPVGDTIKAKRDRAIWGAVKIRNFTYAKRQQVSDCQRIADTANIAEIGISGPSASRLICLMVQCSYRTS